MQTRILEDAKIKNVKYVKHKKIIEDHNENNDSGMGGTTT